MRSFLSHQWRHPKWQFDDVAMTSHQWCHHDVMTWLSHYQTVTLVDVINDVSITSLFHNDVIDDVIRTNRLLMTSSVTSWGRCDIINTSSNCHFGGRTKNDVAMTSWGHDDIIDDVISGQIEVSRGSLQKKSPVFRVEKAELLRVTCTVCLNGNRHAVLGSSQQV